MLPFIMFYTEFSVRICIPLSTKTTSFNNVFYFETFNIKTEPKRKQYLAEVVGSHIVGWEIVLIRALGDR